MAQLVLERFTRCPTGNIVDEVFFEVVLEDDNPLPAKDPTPRTANVVRLFSRGTLAIRQPRDVLLTVGERAQREIVKAVRHVPGDHFDIDLAGLGLTMDWYPSADVELARNFSFYLCAADLAKEAPKIGDRLDAIKGQGR